MRHHEHTEDDHLTHSVVETIVTLLIIILRMVNTRMGYIDVQAMLLKLTITVTLAKKH